MSGPNQTQLLTTLASLCTGPGARNDEQSIRLARSAELETCDFF
jgi:hypothetical protein